MFFHLSRLLFLGFFQFKGNFYVVKIPLVSSDTGVTVVSLSLFLQSYKDELSTIKNDLDQVRKLGFQIMERVPDEKRTGVERRVEEVVHEHRELEKKVRTKEEVSAHALNTTGLWADLDSSLEANLHFRVWRKSSENRLLLQAYCCLSDRVWENSKQNVYAM